MSFDVQRTTFAGIAFAFVGIMLITIGVVGFGIFLCLAAGGMFYLANKSSKQHGGFFKAWMKQVNREASEREHYNRISKEAYADERGRQRARRRW